MWKYVFDIQAQKDFDSYIVWYKNIFEKLYTDTGIWSEVYIVNAYEEEIRNLEKDISDRIKERFTSEILPYKVLPNWRKQSAIFVRDRAVFLEYSDDEIKNTRIIYTLKVIYQH